MGYWGYAAQTYNLSQNRSPHAAIYQSTPYEMEQENSNLEHVRI
jgi:hypothetical protein